MMAQRRDPEASASQGRFRSFSPTEPHWLNSDAFSSLEAVGQGTGVNKGLHYQLE